MNQEKNIKQLPKDWKWTKVSSVAELFRGINYTKDVATNVPTKNNLPILRGNNINGELNYDDLVYVPKELIKAEQLIKKDDIIFAMSSGSKHLVGKSAVAKSDFKGSYGAFCAMLRISDDVNKQYVSYVFKGNSYRKLISEIAKGTNINNLKREHILDFELPLPLKPTQQAIVSKIEELFSELDKGIENLHSAQQQLKTYRQSVLKWAFEGKLTNENVKEGELPEGWKITELGDYIEDISSGKSYRCDERPPGKDEIGIVKVSSVTWGFFDEIESKTCFSKDLLNEKYLIKKNDFLFSRANTIEFIGACVIVHKIDKTLMLSDKILRFTFSKDVSKEYALYYLRSRKGRKQIETLSTGNQDSMRNIGQAKIRQIEFPYCSLKEQNNIVQAIESRLSVADKMEESITQSLQQAEALRQSILKKAFEGRLL